MNLAFMLEVAEAQIAWARGIQQNPLVLHGRNGTIPDSVLWTKAKMLEIQSLELRKQLIQLGADIARKRQLRN